MTQKTKAGPRRLQSLDALRGFDMFFIMGGSGLIAALAGLFPGSPLAAEVARQMHHAAWDGLTHHDTIFPLFLFIAGVSFPFSLESQLQKGLTSQKIYLRIARRGLTLCLLGLLYNGLLEWQPATLRFCSVLSRIGLAWMLGALLYAATFDAARPLRNVRTILVTATSLLVGYWLLTLLVPAPDAGGAGVFERQGNIACWTDRTLLGAHCYAADYDPEGLLSTLPAVSTALLGILAGAWLKYEKTGLSGHRKALGLLAAAALLGLVGYLWHFSCPINKALWSSSFVCAVGSYSFAMLALFYYLIDVCSLRRWSFFFVVIGLNSITIYLLPRFFDFWFTENQLFGGLFRLCPEALQAPLHWCGYLLTGWGILYVLYKNRIFLKV